MNEHPNNDVQFTTTPNQTESDVQPNKPDNVNIASPLSDELDDSEANVDETNNEDETAYKSRQLRNRGGCKRCEVCKKMFASKANMNAHMEAIHKGTRYYCKDCDSHFSFRHNLNMHVNKKHSTKPLPESNVTNDQNITQTPPKKNSLTCDLCFLVFFDFNARIEHAMEVHKKKRTEGLNLGSETENIEPIKNKDDSSPNKSETINSTSNCNPENSNLESAQIASNSTTVKEEDEEQSSTESGLQCDICHRNFTAKWSVQEHKESIHEGIRFLCDHCDHIASSRRNLRVHMGKIHLDKPMPTTYTTMKALDLGKRLHNRQQ